MVSPDEVSAATVSLCEAYEGIWGVGLGGATDQGRTLVTQIMFYDCPRLGGTCETCYETEYENLVLTKIFWTDSDGIQHDALKNTEGDVIAITVPFTQANPNSMLACINGGDMTIPDINFVTYSYCTPLPVTCTMCYEEDVDEPTGEKEIYWVDDAGDHIEALKTATGAIDSITLLLEDVAIATRNDCATRITGLDKDRSVLHRIAFVYCPHSNYVTCEVCYKVEYLEGILGKRGR